MEGNGGGKGRAHTARELSRRCEEYFTLCAEKGRRCTLPGLMLWLGMSEREFQQWRDNGDGRHKAAAEILERAALRMRDELEQRNDTMSIFRLKQPCYGGYADRPRESGEGETRIVVSFQREVQTGQTREEKA